MSRAGLFIPCSRAGRVAQSQANGAGGEGRGAGAAAVAAASGLVSFVGAAARLGSGLELDETRLGLVDSR